MAHILPPLPWIVEKIDQHRQPGTRISQQLPRRGPVFPEFLLCPLQPALVGEGTRDGRVKLEIIRRQEDTWLHRHLGSQCANWVLPSPPLLLYVLFRLTVYLLLGP